MQKAPYAVALVQQDDARDSQDPSCAVVAVSDHPRLVELVTRYMRAVGLIEGDLPVRRRSAKRRPLLRLEATESASEEEGTPVLRMVSGG